MKYSTSLVKNEDVAIKLLAEVFNKGKSLISDIYGVELNDPILSDFEIDTKVDRYCYTIMPIKDISVKFQLKKGDSSLLNEVITINEVVNEFIVFEDFNNNRDAMYGVIDYLEKTYDLDFTPLNPENPDKKIKRIESENSHLRVIFSQNELESDFKAVFVCEDGKNCSLEIEENKNHSIYLD